MGADRAWMHPTVRHVTFSFTFKSHSNQGQFKSHQLTSRWLSAEEEAGRHQEKVASMDTRRRRTCERCTARLNQTQDLSRCAANCAPRPRRFDEMHTSKTGARVFIVYCGFKEIISVFFLMQVGRLNLGCLQCDPNLCQLVNLIMLLINELN